MTPVAAALAVGVAALGPLADPMSPPDPTPRLLDSGQFAALGVGLALVVALLAVIAVGTWKR